MPNNSFSTLDLLHIQQPLLHSVTLSLTRLGSHRKNSYATESITSLNLYIHMWVKTWWDSKIWQAVYPYLVSLNRDCKVVCNNWANQAWEKTIRCMLNVRSYYLEVNYNQHKKGNIKFREAPRLNEDQSCMTCFILLCTIFFRLFNPLLLLYINPHVRKESTFSQTFSSYDMLLVHLR